MRSPKLQQAMWECFTAIHSEEWVRFLQVAPSPQLTPHGAQNGR
jgi:hypothetical protein